MGTGVPIALTRRVAVTRKSRSIKILQTARQHRCVRAYDGAQRRNREQRGLEEGTKRGRKGAVLVHAPPAELARYCGTYMLQLMCIVYTMCIVCIFLGANAQRHLLFSV